jgi:hypothetical protein
MLLIERLLFGRHARHCSVACKHLKIMNADNAARCMTPILFASNAADAVDAADAADAVDVVDAADAVNAADAADAADAANPADAANDANAANAANAADAADAASITPHAPNLFSSNQQNWCMRKTTLQSMNLVRIFEFL